MGKIYTIRQVLEMRINGLKSRQTILKLIENGDLKILDTGTSKKYKKFLITEKSLNKFLNIL